MVATSKRQLVTGENWKYRYWVATYGEVPGAEDLAYYGEDRFMPGSRLPGSNQWGYALGYLTVSASTPEDIAANDWDCGDMTLCAECAENGDPGEGNDWAYYPLSEMNGEIGPDSAVIRCDECCAIIQDAYTTLELEIVQDDETTVYESDHLADELQKYVDGAPASANALRVNWSNPGDHWAYLIIDRERQRDAQHISGGSEPPVIMFADASSPFFLAEVIRQRFGEEFLFWQT